MEREIGQAPSGNHAERFDRTDQRDAVVTNIGIFDIPGDGLKQSAADGDGAIVVDD